jgi:hypothetical protein
MSIQTGKKAEKKIKEWLDRPEDGYCLDRIKDQLSGMWGSKNICDFTLFKSPEFYYIESKETENDRFDFRNITGFDTPDDKSCQYGGLLYKSKIAHVHGVIVLLFTSYKRAFTIDINEIRRLDLSGVKSLNIKKIDKWGIRYTEIQTIPSRKQLLDYEGEFDV